MIINNQQEYIKSLEKKVRKYSFFCSLNVIMIILWINQVLFNNMITFNPQLQFNTFEYQLLQENSIKEPEWCFSFAFNKDSTILAVGCQSYIKLFEFTNGKALLNWKLEHADFVRAIYFMKNSQNFISGGEDSSVLVWHQGQNRQWHISQRLIGHSKPIKHIIMNKNEDLIISCGNDYTIKFWVKQTEWICSQTISTHTQNVVSLSINESQNKLISCSEDKSILVMELSPITNQWIVIQRIFVHEQGKRLCFIGDNQFTFQPKNKNILELYSWNSTSKSFYLEMDIPVDSSTDTNYYFPQKFIHQKQLLINKNGNYINMLRKRADGKFIKEKAIRFSTNQIFGTINDSGDYLVTWDQEHKQLQFRKFSEI